MSYERTEGNTAVTPFRKQGGSVTRWTAKQGPMTFVVWEEVLAPRKISYALYVRRRNRGHRLAAHDDKTRLFRLAHMIDKFKLWEAKL